MKAFIEVECYESEKILRAIQVDAEPTEKFSAKLSEKKEKIILEVESKDISGLMAGINSNLKLIKLAGEVSELDKL